MRRTTTVLLSAALATTMALSACGGDAADTAEGSGTTTTAATTADAASVAAVASIKITGTADKPTVSLGSKPLTVTSTTARVITPGDGATITDKNAITINYAAINGKDGKELESNYGKHVAGLDLAANTLLPGLRTGLVGQTVGSRVLIAMPPADAFGTAGSDSLGVGPTDTVLFLVDIKSARTPLTSATGKTVAPKAGLPTVVPGKDLKTPATITVPKTAAPKELVVQPLIEGTGPVVTAGQTLRTAYTGVIWDGGKQFDSSATTELGYANFVIGRGAVISGWDKALVGQRVGSRVLVVVPPAEGYGSGGQEAAGIKGTDTLVFVVDILDAT